MADTKEAGRYDQFRVDVVADRPKGGMWHTGPNPSWVTVTHLPTMVQARAYHRSQHKAREAAMACVEMMLADCLRAGDVCSYPEALGDADRAPSPQATRWQKEPSHDRHTRAASHPGYGGVAKPRTKPSTVRGFLTALG